MTNIYKRAARAKLRFQAANGVINAEDLWGLSLESLDAFARGISRKLKDAQEESFINTKSQAVEDDELRLEILKDVITTKLEEREQKRKRVADIQQAELLQGILQEKQTESLKNLSVEELQKRIDELKS